MDLFAETIDTIKDQQITSAMDQINQRFGAETVQIGFNLATAAGYVGTKIAFFQIREEEEFR